uniref:G-protein coupled receptors family 1 profile domain-containing protein n=1 Tax=Romanomermis culicivorax TaxID=13658 RepID=A0A915IE26_ROMCU
MTSKVIGQMLREVNVGKKGDNGHVVLNQLIRRQQPKDPRSSLSFNMEDGFSAFSGITTCEFQTLKMSCSRKWAVIILTFSRYYMPVMITLGIVGNLFCVLIFCKTRLYRLPVTRFLIALSLVDSGVLLISLCNIVADPLAVNGLCHFLLYFNNVLCFLSVWLVVSFTLERYIAIKYPLWKMKWDTAKLKKIRKISRFSRKMRIWNNFEGCDTSLHNLLRSK